MQHPQAGLNVPNRTLYHGDNLDFMRALACKGGCKMDVGCETDLRAVRDGFS